MKWAVKRAIGNSKVFAHHQKRAPYWNLITHWITLSSPLDSASLAPLASAGVTREAGLAGIGFPSRTEAPRNC